MGANLWGASPLWEYRLGLIVSKDNHEPKARAMSRGMVWRKPECKRCQATNRNRIVKAEGCEASWHMVANAVPEMTKREIELPDLTASEQAATHQRSQRALQ